MRSMSRNTGSKGQEAKFRKPTEGHSSKTPGGDFVRCAIRYRRRTVLEEIRFMNKFSIFFSMMLAFLFSVAIFNKCKQLHSG
ncbi:MAG TPA: hypothetical protein DE060_03365 [Lentisphaeria bacterium]|nr:hypothetical protein [Lentisphaeria bacterium]HCG48231.1 hypothetical protein [Lentisphaeria bacterium]